MPQHDTPISNAAFDPARLRPRVDGWTPARQYCFIENLAACGSVADAAKRVGMSRASAYTLRNRAEAAAFRLAWDAAMDCAVDRLAEAAMDRAINGVPVPVFHAGEQVGERRVYSEALTMFLLRRRDPARHGQWIDRTHLTERQGLRHSALAYRLGRLLRAGYDWYLRLSGEDRGPVKKEAAAVHGDVGDAGAARDSGMIGRRRMTPEERRARYGSS